MNIEKYQALIREIQATNGAWHAMQVLFGNDAPLAKSSRFLKSRLQLRLLRQYPENVSLEIDNSVESEPLYGIKLRVPVGDRTDAMHLPVRIVNDWLSRQVITQQELDGWLNQQDLGSLDK
ncbi:MAG: hypothetical protein ACO31I_00285 [Prochlorotrichaceae cyanobacterium]|jgi:hypothetical protein